LHDFRDEQTLYRKKLMQIKKAAPAPGAAPAWQPGGGGCQPAVAANVHIRRREACHGDDEDVIATADGAVAPPKREACRARAAETL